MAAHLLHVKVLSRFILMVRAIGMHEGDKASIVATLVAVVLMVPVAESVKNHPALQLQDFHLFRFAEPTPVMLLLTLN